MQEADDVISISESAIADDTFSLSKFTCLTAPTQGRTASDMVLTGAADRSMGLGTFYARVIDEAAGFGEWQPCPQREEPSPPGQVHCDRCGEPLQSAKAEWDANDPLLRNTTRVYRRGENMVIDQLFEDADP